jgi:hypothetical protein
VRQAGLVEPILQVGQKLLELRGVLVKSVQFSHGIRVPSAIENPIAVDVSLTEHEDLQAESVCQSGFKVEPARAVFPVDLL